MKRAKATLLLLLFTTVLLPSFQNVHASTYPQIIAVERTPANPTPDSNVNVTFSVIDKYGLVNISLLYAVNGSLIFHKVGAKIIDGDYQNGTFLAQIPSQPEKARIDYYLEAIDSIGYVAFSNNYSYAVSNDNTVPDIVEVKRVTPTGSPVLPNENVTIKATITDDGSGVRDVTLFYGAGEDPWTMEYNEVAMNKDGTNEYVGVIPGFPNGTRVFYYVAASDNAYNSIEENTRYNYFVNFPARSNLDIIVNITNIDTRNLTATSAITVQGMLPSFEPQPFIIEVLLQNGQLYSMQVNSSLDDRFWYTGKNEYTFYLSGNPNLYPFDSYTLNFTFRIFWSQPQLLTIHTFVSQPLFSNVWNGQYQSYNTTDSYSGLPMVVDTVTIERNIYGDVFPQILLFTMLFFVLGGTLLIAPTKLNERLTIFLGIFIFVAGFYFSLSSIVPIRYGFTFGEGIFLSLVSGSALFTVASLLAATMNSHLKKFHSAKRYPIFLIRNTGIILDGLSVIVFFVLWLAPILMKIPLFNSILIVVAVSYGIILRAILERAKNINRQLEQQIV